MNSILIEILEGGKILAPFHSRKTVTEAADDWSLPFYKAFWNANRSPKIRDLLFFRQNGTCPVCKMRIETIKSGTVHHLTYKWMCHTGLAPLTARVGDLKGRRDPVPDCRHCTNVDPCLERLVMIHGFCHTGIHMHDNDDLRGEMDLDE
jgi:hypothetical protein